MDFISSLPKTQRNMDSIWVIVDKLTKFAHFIPINVRYSLDKLTSLYISEIVSLHGVPSSIVSARDPRITFRFWGSLHQALGTKLNLSSTFHPQMDVLQWHLIKPSTTKGVRLCCVGKSLVVGPGVVQQTTEKVKLIQEKMRVAQSRKKSYQDKRHKDLKFKEGDHVFLKVTSWIEIIKRISKVAYQVSLPSILANLHNLHKYIFYPSHVIELGDIQVHDNLSYEVLPMRIEDRSIKQLKGKEIPLVKVVRKGTSGDVATWELKSQMRVLYPKMFTTGSRLERDGIRRRMQTRWEL
ncbi:hypothetical protein CR513_32951, partial [Mucuna pruriens]